MKSSSLISRHHEPSTTQTSRSTIHHPALSGHLYSPPSSIRQRTSMYLCINYTPKLGAGSCGHSDTTTWSMEGGPVQPSPEAMESWSRAQRQEKEPANRIRHHQLKAAASQHQSPQQCKEQHRNMFRVASRAEAW